MVLPAAIVRLHCDAYRIYIVVLICWLPGRLSKEVVASAASLIPPALLVLKVINEAVSDQAKPVKCSVRGVETGWGLVGDSDRAAWYLLCSPLSLLRGNLW